MFVCILPEKPVPEMIYIVSGGMLNPTHSLTHLLKHCELACRVIKLFLYSVCNTIAAAAAFTATKYYYLLITATSTAIGCAAWIGDPASVRSFMVFQSVKM